MDTAQKNQIITESKVNVKEKEFARRRKVIYLVAFNMKIEISGTCSPIGEDEI